VAAATLALATATKVFAVIALPFFLALRWRAWACFAAVCICLALPFGITDAWRPAGLAVMSDQWLFNAPLYYPLLEFLDLSTARRWYLALFAVIYSILVLRHLRARYLLRSPGATEFPGDWLYGALLFCAPVLNPWYLLWVLPFAAIRPSLWAWTASVSVMLAYGVGLNLGGDLEPYQQPLGLMFIEFLLVVIAFIVELMHCKSRQKSCLS